jgi:hypothetical protein
VVEEHFKSGCKKEGRKVNEESVRNLEMVDGFHVNEIRSRKNIAILKFKYDR